MSKFLKYYSASEDGDAWKLLCYLNTFERQVRTNGPKTDDRPPSNLGHLVLLVALWYQEMFMSSTCNTWPVNLSPQGAHTADCVRSGRHAFSSLSAELKLDPRSSSIIHLLLWYEY